MDAPIKSRDTAEGSQRIYASYASYAPQDAAAREATANMLAVARVAITAELLAKDRARATEVLLSLRLQFSSYSTSTSSVTIK